jgi:hypothetical protein
VHLVTHKRQQVLISDALLFVSKSLQGAREGRTQEENNRLNRSHKFIQEKEVVSVQKRAASFD